MYERVAEGETSNLCNLVSYMADGFRKSIFFSACFVSCLNEMENLGVLQFADLTLRYSGDSTQKG